MAAARRAAPAALLVILAACGQPDGSPSGLPSAVASPTAAPTATSPAASQASPSPTPSPPLSLDTPAASDPRIVALEVSPQLPAGGGGQIVVTVANRSDTRIDEIVLRWPTELKATLVLSPFQPSSERIRDGGPPLVQPWTKWVEGPGERGEPAGTTSLGYGPLDPGATLTIPIFVTRLGPGPLEFDLQILAGEALLTLEAGGPAQVRVSVP